MFLELFSAVMPCAVNAVDCVTRVLLVTSLKANNLMLPTPRLMSDSSLSYTVNRCQSGTRWRKRTHFVSWNDYNNGSDKRCKGRPIACSATGLPLFPLAGISPRPRALWPHLTVAYPPKLAHVLAVAFSSAAERQHLSRLRQGAADSHVYMLGSFLLSADLGSVAASSCGLVWMSRDNHCRHLLHFQVRKKRRMLSLSPSSAGLCGVSGIRGGGRCGTPRSDGSRSGLASVLVPDPSLAHRV